MPNIELVDLLLRVPIILLALTVHEFAHAYSALRMGDPTAYRLGRCSLNPLRHLDPLGTICLLFAPIGWAKPVPVNPLNFHDLRKGDIIVSAAGPLSNLAQALVFALLLRAVYTWGHTLADTGRGRDLLMTLSAFCWLGVQINIGLAIFNLLPLFPLDGFHIVAQLQSPGKAARFQESAAIGPFVILGLVLIGNFTNVNVLGSLIGPPFNFLLTHVAGIPAE